MANIHINDDIYLCLDKDKDDFPAELLSYVDKDLIQLLSDVNDNSVFSILEEEGISDEIKKELFSVVSVEEKEEYLKLASKQGIHVI